MNNYDSNTEIGRLKRENEQLINELDQAKNDTKALVVISSVFALFCLTASAKLMEWI